MTRLSLEIVIAISLKKHHEWILDDASPHLFFILLLLLFFLNKLQYFFSLFCLFPPVAECTRDSDCSSQLACIAEKCKDPCLNTPCGVNALCSVKNHRAICTCKESYTGDPYSFCQERKHAPHTHPYTNISSVLYAHYTIHTQSHTPYIPPHTYTCTTSI